MIWDRPKRVSKYKAAACQMGDHPTSRYLLGCARVHYIIGVWVPQQSDAARQEPDGSPMHQVWLLHAAKHGRNGVVVDESQSGRSFASQEVRAE